MPLHRLERHPENRHFPAGRSEAGRGRAEARETRGHCPLVPRERCPRALACDPARVTCSPGVSRQASRLHAGAPAASSMSDLWGRWSQGPTSGSPLRPEGQGSQPATFRPQVSAKRLRVFCLCLFTNSVQRINSGGEGWASPPPCQLRAAPGPVTPCSVAAGGRLSCGRSEPHSGLRNATHLFPQSGPPSPQ